MLNLIDFYKEVRHFTPHNMSNLYKLGIDIGSTTVKIAILDESHQILFADYERHFANIQETLASLLSKAIDKLGEMTVHPVITGSGGLALANHLEVPFVQEVIAVSSSLQELAPKTDVAIELGGEDAKILFLTDGNNASGLEVRMNGSCAGGTGAFIDQMATLLNITPDELNTLSKEHEKIYTIASRCGVFAKSDVQPLINQGARTEDIAASIYKAVVNQTIAGLAQGRPIKGNILYLGGPLTFSSVLRKSFDEALNVTGTCPENSLLYVALGAALYADKSFVLSEVADALDQYAATATYASEPPLFASKEEYEAFHARHMSHSVPHAGSRSRDRITARTSEAVIRLFSRS